MLPASPQVPFKKPPNVLPQDSLLSVFPLRLESNVHPPSLVVISHIAVKAALAPEPSGSIR